jgi:D-hydroxyproline dehydrogenase subunit alpha
VTFDVAVLGAGPAGLAAARVAVRATHRTGARVVLIDDNPAPGGQIWRGAARIPVPPDVAFLGQARVFDIHAGFTLHTETHGAIHAGRLILATGARELFLPFPGWTEPGVMGAGALQVLAKSGLPVAGKRVAVAGSGPLLVAVAASLRQRGARVLALVEQAPRAALLRFLLRYPAKLPQALSLGVNLLGVPFYSGTWPVRFAGGQVTLSNGRAFAVDFLACGFGLVPNTEAAQLLGCRLDDGFVAVDSRQQTSVEGVYCAGEPTGIGGVDKAIEEGERAGAAATNQPIPPLRSRAFVRDLAETFRLHPALHGLAAKETIVCRCEDVPLAALQPFREWREAKLQTRCGMGPCQGRICGPITAQLFGWSPGSVRPPLVPVPAGCLARVQTPPAPESDRSDTGPHGSR